MEEKYSVKLDGFLRRIEDGRQQTIDAGLLTFKEVLEAMKEEAERRERFEESLRANWHTLTGENL